MKKFLLFFLFIKSTSSANILAIFQNPTISHVTYHSHLMKSLAAKGHNLTIFTAHIISELQNKPNVVQHHFEKSYEIHKSILNSLNYKQKRLKWFDIILNYVQKGFYLTIREEISHPEIQNLLHKSEKYKFDALIIECFYCHLMILAEIYNCPIITNSPVDTSFMMHGVMGNDISPAIYSEPAHLPFLHHSLTFFERIESLLFVVFQLTVGMFFMNKNYGRKIQAEFFPNNQVDVASIMQKRSALLLTNTNVAFGHIRPLMPNTVQIGFSHIEPPKEIEDEKIKEFLDKSTNGVIIMGFGSKHDTRSFKSTIIKNFLNVFNQTKLNILWKSQIENEQMPKNVMTVKNLPIADVLAHKNVKLFINHGGLMSSYEAIDREVPMIVFPIKVDTEANAKMMVHNKIAIELDFNDFSEKELLTAIEEVTKEEYKENIKKLKEKVYDQPMKSLDLAVWHVESVLRNKNELKVPTSDFEEQFRRYYLDVIFITFLLFCLMKKFLIFIKRIFLRCFKNENYHFKKD